MTESAASPSIIESLGRAVSGLSGLEAVAVLLAIGYLLLAVRQNIWCWACAFVSTGIYVYLFYDVALLQESLLNVFYLAMAVYGWWQWRQGGPGGETLPVTTRGPAFHACVVAVTLTVVLIAGTLFDRHTQAAFPYLDAFTTWFAVVTTWMVARKLLENWIYWFVIDAVSIYLYLQKGLLLTAALFALYLVIIVFGFRSWLSDWRAHQAAA